MNFNGALSLFQRWGDLLSDTLGTIVLLILFQNLLCQLCADFGLNRSAIELLIDAVPIR